MLTMNYGISIACPFAPTRGLEARYVAVAILDECCFACVCFFFSREGCSPKSCCLSNALLLFARKFHQAATVPECISSSLTMSVKMWNLPILQMSPESDRQAKRWPLTAVKRQSRTPGATPKLDQIGE